MAKRGQPSRKFWEKPADKQGNVPKEQQYDIRGRPVDDDGNVIETDTSSEE